MNKPTMNQQKLELQIEVEQLFFYQEIIEESVIRLIGSNVDKEINKSLNEAFVRAKGLKHVFKNILKQLRSKLI